MFLIAICGDDEPVPAVPGLRVAAGLRTEFSHLLTDEALDHYQTLEQQRNAAADDAAGALDLVSRLREALGDHGLRMQDELLKYCRELAARAVPHA